MRAKTLLVTTPYFPPYGGGLEKYAFEILTKLHHTYGWRVVVVTSGEKGTRDTKTNESGLTVYRLGYSWKVSNTPFSLRWFKKTRHIIQEEDPDEINIQMPVPGIGDVVAFVAPRHIPIVVTYHANSMVKGSFFIDLLIRAYEKGPLACLLRRAKKIICSSDTIRLQFLRQYVDKSVTIMPAVDEKIFMSERATKMKRPTILFVAGLGVAEQHKGLRTLIDAVAIIKNSVPHVLLCVVGDGDMRHQYETYVKDQGLKDHVIFKGKLNGKALADMYRSAHVFSLPTINDSLPMVIIEAMACGIPVVSTPTGSIPLLVVDGETGFLCKPNDSNMLAERITTLLLDPVYAASLGRCARHKVSEEFTWTKRSASYHACLEEVLLAKDTSLKEIKQKNILMLVSGTVHSNFTYRAYMLGRELVKKGHRVSMIAPTADKYSSFKPETFTELEGMHIIRPFQFRTRKVVLNLIPYMLSALWSIIRSKADTIYIYKPTPITVIGLVAKIIRPKTTVILDIDDLGSEVMKIEGHPTYQRVLVAWSEHLSARFADRIIVASHYLNRLMKSAYPDKPLLYMPNGVDHEWFEYAHKTEGNIVAHHTIVFMGSINRKEILEPLFDVLPDLIRIDPKVEVLIMGDGEYMRYFKDKSETLGIDDHVVFTGWLALKEVRSRLSFGALGYNYMPNQQTVQAASNMKLPQYMACGVVPIVSDVGDQTMTIDYGAVGYLCKADDVDSLKNIYLEALRDPHRLEKAHAARKRAEALYDWEKLAHRFHVWVYGDKLYSDDAHLDIQEKRIVVVETCVPGNTGGGEIRNFQLLQSMARMEHTSVELFCISENDADNDRVRIESNLPIKAHVFKNKRVTMVGMLRAIILERVPPFMSAYRRSGIGKAFKKACTKSLPDIVHIEQLDAYYCIRRYIPWLQSRGVTVVLDAHNIEAEAFRGSLKLFSSIKRRVGLYLAPKLDALEKEATGTVDCVLACSSHDAENLNRHAKKETIVIPNGVDSEYFTPSSQKNNEPTLLFIGGVSYPPNADALLFYIRCIHHIVQKEIPRIRVCAIGATHEWLTQHDIHDDSIIPLGFVDDIRPCLDQATIGLCPIREGSGTRLKVLTYMSAGLPVVSTTKGSEGIAYTDGKNIAIADEPYLFVKHIVDLVRDSSLRYAMGKQGRALVREKYDWNIIGTKLRDLYAKIGPIQEKKQKSETGRRVRSYFLPIFIGLLIVDLVGFFTMHLAYAGVVVAVVYMISVPGLLLLAFFADRRLPLPLGSTLSVALSIFILMVIGGLANTLLPMVGVEKPLATIPLLLIFNILIVALFVAGRKKIFPLKTLRLHVRDRMIVGGAFLVPLLVAFGAIRLNNGASNILTMVAIGLMAFLVSAVLLTMTSLRKTTPPLVLFLMALGLLLMSSLRGWFITGHDVMLEYQVFDMTLKEHFWNIAAFRDPYNACLSITVLPTYIQSIVHIDPAYVYKLIFQCINALQAVIMYYISRRYTSPSIAFLIGFSYITFPTFMVDMSMLNRQTIAFVFFGAMLYTMFAPKFFVNDTKRTVLVYIFGFGMIISHYSTSYIAIVLLLMGYIINKIMRFVVSLQKPRFVVWLTDYIVHKEIYQKPILLTFPFVVTMLVVGVLWSSVVTKTSHNMQVALERIAVSLKDPFSKSVTTGPAKYGLGESEDLTKSQLFDLFVQKKARDITLYEHSTNLYPAEITSRYTSVVLEEPLLPLTPLGQRVQGLFSKPLSDVYEIIKQTYAKLLQILLIVGIVGIFFGYRFGRTVKKDVPAEYISLAFAGILLMAIQMILPAYAVDYGILRLFQQNLILLALPIGLGVIGCVQFIAWMIHAKNKGGFSASLIVYAGFLLICFLFLSGFIPQITGGGRAVLPLNNGGLYYDMYYTHASDVQSMQWLARHVGRHPAQTNKYYSSIKMQAYADVAPDIDLLPETIRKDAFVYLGSDVVREGHIIEYVGGDIVYYKFPLSFLDDNKNLLYSNNGARIYR